MSQFARSAMCVLTFCFMKFSFYIIMGLSATQVDGRVWIYSCCICLQSPVENDKTKRLVFDAWTVYQTRRGYSTKFVKKQNAVKRVQTACPNVQVGHLQYFVLRQFRRLYTLYPSINRLLIAISCDDRMPLRVCIARCRIPLEF